MDPQLLWFASRATGAVSLVLFTAVLVLGILTAGRAEVGYIPRAGLLRLHRSLTLLSIAFLAAHIVTAVADGYVDLNYWDVVLPFGAGYSPFWIGLASVAVDLLIAVVVTSLLRRRLPLRVWRGVHLASYALWPLAALHGWGTSGGDGRQTWMIVLDIVCAIAVLAAIGFRLRPDRHPDTVARRTSAPAVPPGREEAGR